MRDVELMPLHHLLIAAAAFGAPASDAELAASTSVARPVSAAFLPVDLPGSRATTDATDHWWANEGIALIAPAARTIPLVPRGLDLDTLRAGHPGIRYTISVEATTRP